MYTAINKLRGGAQGATPPASFLAELDRQCRRVSLAGSIIAILAWIPYIPIDRELHPQQPALIYWRIGFSIIGIGTALLHFIPGMRFLGLTVLLVVGFYMEIATAVITALTGGDPAYVGGYCIVIMLIPLGPLPRKVAWGMLFSSLLCFLAIVLNTGWNLQSKAVLYAAQNLAVAGFMSAFFIFITDKLRQRSWQSVNQTKGNLRRQTLARNIAETQQQQTEDLNSLLKKINEKPDIDSVMQVISGYVAQKYALPYHCLFRSNSEDTMLRFAHAHLPDFVRTEDRRFFTTLAFQADSRTDDNLYTKAIHNKLPMFAADIASQSHSALDMRLHEALGQKSLVTLPVFLAGKLIATLDFYSNETVEISDEHMSEMGILAEHLAGVINSSLLLTQVQQAVHEAEASRADLQISHHETEQLAALARRANQAMSLDEIIRAIAEITDEHFGGNRLAFFSVSANRDNLIFQTGTVDGRSVPQSEVPHDMQVIALIPETGSLYRTYLKKRTFYTNKIVSMGAAASAVDKLIAKEWQLQWILQLPLIVSEEVVAIISVSGSEERRLKKEEIRFCERLAAQVSGSVRALQNLENVNTARRIAESERAIAEIAQQETEKARNETQALNHLIKSLNENLDLTVICDKIHAYVKENFGIQYYALYGLTPDKESLSPLRISFPEYSDPKDREAFLKSRIAIKNVRGAHAFTFHARRPWYLRKVKRKGVTPEELFAIDKLRMESFLMLPLILQGEPVGTLDFWNDGKLDLTQNQISRLSILAEQLAGIIYGSNLFREVQVEKTRSDNLLLNILPAKIAEELKTQHQVKPQYFESVSVLFTDFVGFTQISEKLTPDALVQELDGCFSQFDEVARRNNLEKLKTIGDAYMCAAGLPVKNSHHAVDICLAALEFRAFMLQMQQIKDSMQLPYWRLRLGIHSGPVTAGVIGTNKFAYDIWGDTVNTASRMESSGEPGEINISGTTYELVKHLFECEYRGKIKAKGKGEIDMYFLLRIKPELAADAEGMLPNGKFLEKTVTGGTLVAAG